MYKYKIDFLFYILVGMKSSTMGYDIFVKDEYGDTITHLYLSYNFGTIHTSIRAVSKDIPKAMNYSPEYIETLVKEAYFNVRDHMTNKTVGQALARMTTSLCALTNLGVCVGSPDYSEPNWGWGLRKGVEMEDMERCEVFMYHLNYFKKTLQNLDTSYIINVD